MQKSGGKHMNEIFLNGQSMDLAASNIEKLKQIFPEVFTDGKIDFAKLRQVLGNYIETGNERYNFTWNGKSEALRRSQIPSAGTLRPSIKYPDGQDESKDWDTTGNLYIEGDNLEVLKLLQKSYNGKIKMIYIDPPYNKDKDFIYSDKHKDPIQHYKKITGQIDDDGHVTTSDIETEGGKHTNWLNMIYPRLRLARNLLADDGVIFISIDDEEMANLKKLCDEIFGEENFVEVFLWTKTSTPPSLSNKSRKTVEFILCYEKNKNNYRYYGSDLDNGDAPLLNTGNPKRRLVFPPGTVHFTFVEDAAFKAGIYEKVKLLNDIVVKNGKNLTEMIVEGEFKWSNETLKNEIDQGTYFLVKSEKFSIRFQRKEDENKYKTPTNLLDIELNKETGVGTNESAVKELEELGLKGCFDYPKPVTLLKRLIKMVANDDKECIIMDFFSGSATTAHAVMELNAEDKGKRRFIMVQLPENLDETLRRADANARKTIENAIKVLDELDKPHLLTEIGKYRIRRAGEAIKKKLREKYQSSVQQEKNLLPDDESNEVPIHPDQLDVGFKVFKLDSSNLRKWSAEVPEDFYNLDREEQNAILAEILGLEVNNFVEGRSELDVVYEIILKYGIDLSLPIEEFILNHKKVFSIGSGALIICLDDDLDVPLAEDIIKLIHDLQPSRVRVVVRDLSFYTDSQKTNFKETLKNGVYAYFGKSGDKANKENQFDFVTI
jgi:adenine-specific DNA-methyltransferase